LSAEAKKLSGCRLVIESDRELTPGSRCLAILTPPGDRGRDLLQALCLVHAAVPASGRYRMEMEPTECLGAGWGELRRRGGC
jgi:hypothetical protein